MYKIDRRGPAGKFLSIGIPISDLRNSDWGMKSLCFFIPIVHEAEIDSVNRAVEPIGLQIGRPTPVEKKDKFYVAVLKLQWTDDLKSVFIHKRCIKRKFVPDSGRSVGPNLSKEFQVFKELMLTLVVVEYAAVAISCMVAAVTFGVAAAIGALINRMTLDWSRLRRRKRLMSEAIHMNQLLNTEEVWIVEKYDSLAHIFNNVM